MLACAQRVPGRLLPHGPLDLLLQVLLFALAYNAYRLVRGGVDDPAGAAVAFENARLLIDAEQALGFFVEPSVQAWTAAKPLLMDFSSWMYINAQTSVTIGALLYLYLFHNSSYYFVRNMFMVALGIALLGYTIFPTAPPRFFPEWGFFDSVSDFVGVGHDSVAVNALFNPYAAVPSMHACFALMLAVPMIRLAKRSATRVVWALYPVFVTFVIVATANHFLADAVLGAVTAAVAGWAAAWLARARPAHWTFGPSEATISA